jgi:hypothetical protein
MVILPEGNPNPEFPATMTPTGHDKPYPTEMGPVANVPPPTDPTNVWLFSGEMVTGTSLEMLGPFLASPL